jgi:phospholipid/cholesterol/gamma-HCH transport system substrate-binding protein
MKNFIIGIFVLCAFAITVSVILFIEPTIGDGKKQYTVRFANIAGINVGTRVTLAGKPIGEVVDIKMAKDAREGRMDSHGRIYFYQLTIKTDSTVTIYDRDEVAISTTGLMGERSIAIIPKCFEKGKANRLIAENEIIYGSSVDSLQNTLKELPKAAEAISTTVKDFNIWFKKNTDHLSSAIENFSNTMGQMDKVLNEFNEKTMMIDVKDAITSFSTNMHRIDKFLQEVEKNKMLSKLNTSMENMATFSNYLANDGNEILQSLNKVMKQIASGEGTLGKALQRDDLYLKVSALLGKADVLMNDINHYGLLFQYNKTWQKARTKRANILQTLNSPKDFKNYFEDEISTINTSLGRLSSLLDKANDKEQKEKIINTENFKKEFTSLLKDVESLSESLRLYNEELAPKMDN